MTDRLLDADWLAAHPLPGLDEVMDKNGRGRVLVVGGAEFVPGALRLTGEAALRAGAGKLQMATVGAVAMSLGVLVPEAAMIALPADKDGEIAAEAADILLQRLERCDALILGPGMSAGDRTHQLVAGLLAAPDAARTIILDAAALTSARDLAPLIAQHEGRVILTPHHGEMAQLAGKDIDVIKARPEAIAAETAVQFGAVILLKSKDSILAAPDGTVLHHKGGCVGLATGGSGDVLAGIIGGLAARGAAPLAAAGWGSWVHGRAGEVLAHEIGEVGFLARELLPLIPRLVDQASARWIDRNPDQGSRVSKAYDAPSEALMTVSEKPDIAAIAGKHGLSEGAVQVALEALRAGQGHQAQFNHPDLGGMGQWSRGGMLMIGEMFNDRLKGRIAALFDDLAPYGDVPSPERARGAMSTVSGKASRWPVALGAPSSTGSQNGMHYAVFPEARRLAVEQNGKCTIYDTADHQISGVSQQQSGGQNLSFTGSGGTISLADLTVVADGNPIKGEIETLPSEDQKATESPDSGDIADRIVRLHDLLSKGALTQEEFDSAKRRLLDQI